MHGLKYKDDTPEINELLSFAEQNNSLAIVKKMKEIVPEFVSMNSDYEK